jgi:deazaflavin-dependent oxidoreductase (nitroreductase family)
MPLPGWLGRFNRVATNYATRPLARRLPWFAVVVHRGRRSGRTYRTPVNAFRSGDRYLIALTYGADRDWVKNVVAAGGCHVETRGRRRRLVDPVIVSDHRHERFPAPIRPILSALRVTEALELRPAAAGAPRMSEG